MSDDQRPGIYVPESTGDRATVEGNTVTDNGGHTPRHAAQPTQVRRPWRAVARTVFQAGVAAAALGPAVYSAATNDEPAQATGLVGGALVVCAGVTRVMALPGVNDWLRRFVPFLAADKA